MDWTDLFSNNNIVPTILKLLGAKYIDQKNEQSSITPMDAIKGSNEKGLTGQQQYVNDRLADMAATQRGETQNPMLAQARQTANAAFMTPRNQVAGIYGQPGSVLNQQNNPLLARLLSYANGTQQNPLLQQGNQNLMNAMKTRFGG